MELAIEVAKQVPALAALITLVVVMFRDRTAEAQKSEERLKAVVDQQDRTIKSVVDVLQANNQNLGSVQTLFMLIEKDLKDASKRKP